MTKITAERACEILQQKSDAPDAGLPGIVENHAAYRLGALAILALVARRKARKARRDNRLVDVSESDARIAEDAFFAAVGP